MQEPCTVRTDEEQLVYAHLLEKGMYTGLGLLVATFIAYVLRIVPPAVPLWEVEQYWNQNVESYLMAINQNALHLEHVPTGWAWLNLLHKGDFLNFIGIALLAGVTILCYLAIVPVLLKKGDKVYALIALAEAAVLALAASGVLAVGH